MWLCLGSQSSQGDLDVCCNSLKLVSVGGIFVMLPAAKLPPESYRLLRNGGGELLNCGESEKAKQRCLLAAEGAACVTEAVMSFP